MELSPRLTVWDRARNVSAAMKGSRTQPAETHRSHTHSTQRHKALTVEKKWPGLRLRAVPGWYCMRDGADGGRTEKRGGLKGASTKSGGPNQNRGNRNIL